MGGHGHDGARPVIHQDIIGDPDRDALARKRVDHLPARVQALLFLLAGNLPHPGFAAAPGHVGPQALFLRGTGEKLAAQGMVGGEKHERGAEDGVDPRREDLDARPAALEAERDQGPLARPDPVPLHLDDMLGPLSEHPMAVEEFLGIGRDLQEPVLHFLQLDGRFAPPAAAAGRLLVSQHRLALGAPVDPAFLAESQPPLEHLQEDPLVPLVVLGQAGVDLPRPVVAEPEPLELALHVRDVVEGPLLGVDPVLDGRVFGGHPEGVPADRMEDVKTPHQPETGEDIADGIVPDMTHVDPARRIGIHLQAVIFRAAGVLGGLEHRLLVPGSLPLGLDLAEWIGVFHRLDLPIIS